ncbi:exodeoxyribonuclease VII small subunit [Campylobacter sp. 19-13652]|uniref:exodeoxyribonuclease VII small subunit n=1 Tax=Campylobacter sp. 19-13652 TaxID=2840180 RepID=UPI001C7605DE|nr:exodeoxyribonuclease VII small subunit [Campylobacter sp. 19-13652]BCX79784.1 hypothetical protein LBC_12460 [Campylobacter sp. 19-13652]
MQENSFEAKLSKASEILKLLNDENTSLEKSVELHKEGKRLLSEASQILNEAKLSIEEVNEE